MNYRKRGLRKLLGLLLGGRISKMDSNTGRLEGRRVGDKFYHANGEVSHADTNAAINIKHRGDDTEITLWTPYRGAKAILLGRMIADGGVRDRSRDPDRPSRTPVTHSKEVLTESKLADDFTQLDPSGRFE